jgi:GT2 family glycosyltransferase
MLTTAVVILNWNGKLFLEKFLAGVVKHSLSDDCGVFVADNGSTDDSVVWLEMHFPQVGIIKLMHNYGFAGGYNMALQQIDADYFVLLNSDVEVSQGWIDPVLHVLQHDETVAVAVPKIRSFQQPAWFEYAGAAGGFIDRYGYPFCRGRIFDTLEEDRNQYNDRVELFWASGAAFFVRARLFKQLGGFDADFFAHMEEIDLCWRFKNLGYRIIYEPGSIVFHVGGGTLPNEHPHKLYLNFRNNLFLLMKNLASEDLIPVLFIRWILDLVAAAKFLVNMHFSQFFAIIKAHLHFLLAIPLLIGKRRKLMKRFVGFHHPEIYTKSIVIQYFLKGKKYFSQLEAWPNKARRIEPDEDENPLC